VKLILCALILSACTPTDQTEPPLTYEEACGSAPSAPGVQAALDGDTVTMTRQVYLDLLSYRTSATQWADCVSSLDVQ
jgi:hypothetical protein